MPTNTTPEAAQVIPSLPFTATQDPDGGADSTYLPACEATAYRKPLWFVFTPTAGQTAVGVVFSTTDIGADYSPFLSVWTGVPPGLTPVAGICFDGTGYPTQQQISLTPGVPYYFQFTDDHDTPAGASLTWSLELAPDGASTPGAIFVANDTANFPAAILDQATGTVLRILGFPAFECADILPDGTLLCAAEDADFEIVSYDVFSSALTRTAQVTSIVQPSQSAVSPVRSNGSDTFYVAVVVSGQRTVIHTISREGVVGGVSWTLPANGDALRAMAPSADGTVLYYGGNNVAGDSTIYRYDLVNNAPLSNLVASAGGNSGIDRDLYLLADGTLLVVYITNFLSHTGTEIRRYSTAGALLNTYTVGTSLGSSPRIFPAVDNPTSFWCMSFPVGVGFNAYTRFQRFDVATGTVLTTFDVFQKDAGANNERLYGPSQSCPLLILPLASGEVALTQLTHDCLTGLFTLTGVGFDTLSAALTSVTRDGTDVGFTVQSQSATVITFTLTDAFIDGTYCVVVTSDLGPTDPLCATFQCTVPSCEVANDFGTTLVGTSEGCRVSNTFGAQ